MTLPLLTAVVGENHSSTVSNATCTRDSHTPQLQEAQPLRKASKVWRQHCQRCPLPCLPGLHDSASINLSITAAAQTQQGAVSVLTVAARSHTT